MNYSNVDKLLKCKPLIYFLVISVWSPWKGPAQVACCGSVIDQQPQWLPLVATTALHPGQASPGQLPASPWAQRGCWCRPVPTGVSPFTGDFGSRTPIGLVEASMTLCCSLRHPSPPALLPSRSPSPGPDCALSLSLLPRLPLHVLYCHFLHETSCLSWHHFLEGLDLHKQL